MAKPTLIKVKYYYKERILDKKVSCIYVYDIIGGEQGGEQDAYHGYGQPQQSSGGGGGYQKPDVQQAARYAKQQAEDDDDGN